jgi:hypothetical protein
MLLDPEFAAFLFRLILQAGHLAPSQLPVDVDYTVPFVPRLVLLGLISISAVVTTLSLGFGAMAGPREFRTLKSWLVLVGLIGAWFGLIGSWSSICWIGKKYRMRGERDVFAAIATSLREDWPQQDGNRPEIGPFMAYPVGQPSTLILLTLPDLPDTNATISLVERSRGGGLHFELAGSERGDWLEWHPAGAKPASYIGGLMEPRDLVRFESLGDGWYLVRYRR